MQAENQKREYCSRGTNGEAVLLLHGLTANPFIFHHLSEVLEQEGYSILAPLLPGHGTTPEDLATTTWKDWMEATQNSLTKLTKQVDRIYVIGVSLGGNLALSVAAKNPDKISKIVTIGTPIRLYNHITIRTLLPFVSRIKKFKPKPGVEKEKEYFDKYGTYPVWPYRSLSQLMQGIKETKKSLRHITIPTMLIHAANDPIIHPKSGIYILNNISVPKNLIKKIKIPNGKHVPIIGKGRDKTIAEITTFINTPHHTNKME